MATELGMITNIVQEGVFSFLHLLPYLLVGLLAAALLEAALNRYKEIGWLKKKSGMSSYFLISLVGVGTPL